MNKAKIAGLLAGLAVSLGAMAAPTDSAVQVPPGVVKPAFFESHGIHVVGYQKGVGGLNVWQVERNGMQTVFYTTPDNKALISGVLWDAATGAVQSDAYITTAMTSPANVARIKGEASVTQAVADAASGVQVAERSGSQAPEKASPGGVSESISGVAALTGIKEGRGSAARTIYIMFDPRCPHCRNVYDQSRDFVRRGGSIKWLPVTVLGNAPDGLNRVAAILQSKDPVQAMNVIEHSAVVPQADVKPTTVNTVSANEAYFWAAYTRNPSAGQPGVPVAFFQDRNGAPQMVSDIDDPALLKRIFGEMGK
ncbi:DsbC family protein [Burkholderia vietnamiensis]|uniref:DsbC family protein n=1 Tax=Burkholderia vietnamiensis TaxID=60552 RepID=UPI001CF27529|nr:DsbC family protein [Burkholderia vietnamiensis]MCA8197359.1 DsbC family protein [Burkholderia vietnamiensis]